MRTNIDIDDRLMRQAMRRSHQECHGGENPAIVVTDARAGLHPSYWWLRRPSYTVCKTIDCLIATFCIEAGHSLLQRDHDFDPFAEHLGLCAVQP